MDLATILFLAALTIFAAAFIARPLVEHEGRVVTRRERELSELVAERERLLDAIQELDLDFSMGKLTSEDYDAQRTSLVARGASVLRQIDALGNVGVVEDDPDPVERPAVRESLEDEIEALVAELRQQSRGTASYCGNCGAPIVAGDRYCARCGTAVEVEMEGSRA